MEPLQRLIPPETPPPKFVFRVFKAFIPKQAPPTLCASTCLSKGGRPVTALFVNLPVSPPPLPLPLPHSHSCGNYASKLPLNDVFCSLDQDTRCRNLGT